VKRVNFYCTEELFNWLQSQYGGEDGRAGRMSANIERILWAYKKESTPTPPKEKSGPTTQK